MILLRTNINKLRKITVMLGSSTSNPRRRNLSHCLKKKLKNLQGNSWLSLSHLKRKKHQRFPTIKKKWTLMKKEISPKSKDLWIYHQEPQFIWAKVSSITLFRMEMKAWSMSIQRFQYRQEWTITLWILQEMNFQAGTWWTRSAQREEKTKGCHPFNPSTQVSTGRRKKYSNFKPTIT